MDSIRVSEAPDTGSIPVEATFSPLSPFQKGSVEDCFKIYLALNIRKNELAIKP